MIDMKFTWTIALTLALVRNVVKHHTHSFIQLLGDLGQEPFQPEALQ